MILNKVEIPLVIIDDWLNPPSMGGNIVEAIREYDSFRKNKKTFKLGTTFVFSVIDEYQDFLQIEVPLVEWLGCSFNSFRGHFWIHKSFCTSFVGKLCYKCHYLCRQECPQSC